MGNAIKFSHDDNAVTVTLGINNRLCIYVSVADSGIGIAPDDLTRILESFSQAQSSAEVAHDGTGLGLSLSTSLMELHGGSLEIESGSEREHW